MYLMKDMSECRIVRKASSICRSLADIRIKEDHDLTFKIYNASSKESPECEHIITGSSDHSLIKAIATVGAVSLIMTAFCTACSMLRN